MEHTLNHGMCRCCASEGMFKNFSATYQWMGADEVYSDMLKECFDIALTHAEDCNNGGICEVCITQLRNASNFKKQVLQTEEQFKKMVQDNLFKTNIVKVENSKDEDELESEPDNLSDPDYSGTEFEVPVKEEVIEPKTRKRAAKASTSSAKKAKTEDGEPSRTLRQERDNLLKLDLGMINKIRVSSTNNSNEKRSHKPLSELAQNRFNLNQILQYSNATPIRNHGDIGYMCCECNAQYPDPSDLKQHTLDTHDYDSLFEALKRRNDYSVKLDITGLQCKECEEEMKEVDELVNHLVDLHGKQLYKNINSYIIPLKFNGLGFQCYICLAPFHKYKVFVEHMSRHSRNFVCEICDSGFPNVRLYKHHLRTHQIGIFNCKYCSKTFNTKVKAQSHERSMHKFNFMLYKCGFCNEKFNDYNKKMVHLAELHGAEVIEVKCSACDRTFANNKALRVHVRKDHLLQRPYKCPECGFRFYSRTDLNNHMVKHTGLKEFQCQICLKSFAHKKGLIVHMRIHEDDRRFKCEYCGMAFIQRCTWKMHVLARHKVDVK